MKELMCGTIWVPYICHKLEYAPTPTAQSIVCVERGNFVAGALFDKYLGSIVSAHILIEGSPSKDWFACIYDYPFNVLKVRKILGSVNGDNKKAIEFDKSMGFIEEARITDYFPSGADLVLLTMTREQCRILNEPRWADIVKKVSVNGRD